jgi:hypothetical protein
MRMASSSGWYLTPCKGLATFTEPVFCGGLPLRQRLFEPRLELGHAAPVHACLIAFRLVL